MDAKTRLTIRLGITQIISWGSGFYIPAVLAVPITLSLGISTELFFWAFTLSLLVSGLIGPRIGKAIDKLGGRKVLPFGSVAFFLGLVLLATAQETNQLFVAWFLIGIGGSMGNYDAAFATAVNFFGNKSNQIIAGITVFAGFSSTISWPVTTPGFLLNRMSISAFNALYRRRPAARYCGPLHYDPFFYPLDGIRGWNRMYGSRGFYQHQSLIPYAEAEAGIAELLGRIAKGGQGSFLAVLKVHGEEPSPGVMSFCRPGKGVSLALDFANRGKSTRRLLSDLDLIVRKRGGRLYPAKDAHMAADFFQESYPHWRRLEEARDPALSSSFWRRVTQTSGAIVQT